MIDFEKTDYPDDEREFDDVLDHALFSEYEDFTEEDDPINLDESNNHEFPDEDPSHYRRLSEY